MKLIIQIPCHNEAETLPLTLRDLLGINEIVVGDRGMADLAHFSLTKRLLQRMGSWVMQSASGLNVPDATSEFRAFSREAAVLITLVFRSATFWFALVVGGATFRFLQR
jgi:hypothetical protein